MGTGLIRMQLESSPHDGKVCLFTGGLSTRISARENLPGVKLPTTPPSAVLNKSENSSQRLRCASMASYLGVRSEGEVGPHEGKEGEMRQHCLMHNWKRGF